MQGAPGTIESNTPDSLPESRTGGAFLIVVIPCLDEQETVGRVIRAIPREIPGVEGIEVLVIDDGSSDATAERAREAGAEVISHPTNRGLGRCFREAVEIAVERGADILVNIDGDGQFDAADIPTIVAPVIDRRAAMATASRFLERELVPEMPAVKRWGNRRVAGIVALLTGKRFHDVSCGFRALSAEALLRLNLFGSFTYTQETFLDLAFKDLSVVEISVKVRGSREFGESRVASSLVSYAVRSLRIMLSAFISYRPFVFFACISSVFLALGGSLLSFLGYHYWVSGAFTPHIWAGFIGGSFVFLGILTLVIGLIGDMLVRIRLNQEHQLYLLKRASWARSRAGEAAR